MKLCTVCTKENLRAGKTCSRECQVKAQGARVLPEKNCAVCGKSFAPSGPRSTKCEVCSLKKCTICGELVPKSRTGVTCSSECSYKARAKALPLAKCSFINCSNEFKPHNPQEKWCYEQHSLVCSECKTVFEIEAMENPIELCKVHRKLQGNANRKAGQKKAFQAKYGVDSAFHVPGIQQKIREANEKKYGFENQFQRPEIIEAIKERSFETYGVRYSSQREDVKEKIKATNLERYGTPVASQSKIVQDKMKATSLERYGVENYFHLENINTPNRISKINLFWQSLIEENTKTNVVLEKKFASADFCYFIDLYIELNGVKLGIEISPTATHNSHQHKIACNKRGCTVFPCKDHGKDKKYHADKVKNLKTVYGVELITIFDWTDEEKMLNFIKAKLKLQENKVGAKKCELKKITQREANKFFEAYHLLGASRLQKHCYGLFYKGELVQVQSFALHKEGWEAKRLATKPGWVVIGGVSRGTKAFIKEVSPEKIVAYSDLNLGYAEFDKNFNEFVERKELPAQKCWSKGKRMILAKSAAFQSADRLIGIATDSKSSKYPEDWSNDEVFLAEGWLPVWDCGMLKETWVSGV